MKTLISAHIILAGMLILVVCSPQGGGGGELTSQVWILTSLGG